MQQPIIDNYTLNAQLAGQQAAKYKKLADTYSLMRLGIFALMILAIYFAVVKDNFNIMAIAFPLLMLGFAWLVSRQSIFEQQKEYFLNLQRVNENEITNINTRANLYDNGEAYNNEKHYYSADLDIFGHASLFHFINRAATQPGNTMLAEWLSTPANKKTILSRQEAIKELAAKDQWKPELQTLLLFAKNEDADQLKLLFNYLRVPLNIPGENGLLKYIKIAPFLLTAAIIGAWWLPASKFIAIILAAANLIIVSSKGSYIAKSSFIADKISKVLSAYAAVFSKIENTEWQSSYTTDLADRIKQKQTSKNITELAKLINKLSYNLVMIVNFILNVFFLWALKQVIAIEQWKRNNHTNLEDSFDVIADYEALISLSSLQINYPDWCLPEIADSEGYTLIATELAHPLIPANSRMVNDYELDNTFKVDIITGSNMAGKSTFLRTIGINTVLALCGAPVCAKSMQVSVMTMVSYMRIKDSLNESTSTFKAELDRLQMLLAAVDNTNPKVFFLIDEMLRGTNSVDKYRGSKAVIEQLIRKKGVGMVATHDLQIAQLEQQYPDYVRNFYFDIQVKNGEMLFDYKMKHGECKTFNATLLLKQIGIDID
ncbi:MAG: DNA mismatch repair protein MutS [Mucilaginibacter sp.]